LPPDGCRCSVEQQWGLARSGPSTPASNVGIVHALMKRAEGELSRGTTRGHDRLPERAWMGLRPSAATRADGPTRAGAWTWPPACSGTRSRCSGSWTGPGCPRLTTRPSAPSGWPSSTTIYPAASEVNLLYASGLGAALEAATPARRGSSSKKIHGVQSSPGKLGRRC
jgi:hypothetical protein